MRNFYSEDFVSVAMKEKFDFTKLVGRSLRNYREACRLKMSDVADHFGTTVVQLSNWEIGRDIISEKDSITLLIRITELDMLGKKRIKGNLSDWPTMEALAENSRLRWEDKKARGGDL